MNSERIIDAMEFIDESYIEQTYALKIYPKSRSRIWIKYLSIAACVAVILIGALSSGIFDNSDIYCTLYPENSADDSLNYEDSIPNTPSLDSSTIANDENSYMGQSASQKITIYIEVIELIDNGFTAKIIDNNGNEQLTNDYIYNAIYDSSSTFNYKLQIGDKAKIVCRYNGIKLVVYEIEK